MVQLLPAFILLIYPLTFLNPGESMLVLKALNPIDEEKYCRLLTTLNVWIFEEVSHIDVYYLNVH
jgi:hypothetical protein